MTAANKKECILSGRVAVVTGASRGIGRAVAIRLAEAGCKLAVFGRQMDTLLPIKEQIESIQTACFAAKCDVSDFAELEKCLNDAQTALGSISILVNNAGIYATQPVQNHELALWQQTMNTNLTSAMLASRHVLTGMIKDSWGRIVNISSISGKQAEAYGAAYSASKFGMIGLTQALALEVARHGITVNAVCPGWVNTDMATKQLEDDTWCGLNKIDRHESIEIARLSIPTERFVEPEEVAHLVSFLCSPEAGSITGQSINICGGLSIH
jgi:ketoreductase